MKCGLRKVDFEKYIGLDSAFVKCFALVIIFYFELWQPLYNYKPLLTVLCIHFLYMWITVMYTLVILMISVQRLYKCSITNVYILCCIMLYNGIIRT